MSAPEKKRGVRIVLASGETVELPGYVSYAVAAGALTITNDRGYEGKLKGWAQGEWKSFEEFER